MYGLQIPNNSLLEQLQNNVTVNRDAYTLKQLQISRGKKYTKRSENAIETEEAAIISNANKLNERWRANISQARGWEQSTDGSLQKVLQSVQRVTELGVQVNNGVNDPTARKNLSTEVNWLLETIFEDANQSFLGVALYGGTDTDSNPFTATYDAEGRITGVTYNGSVDERTIQITETSTADYGLVGGGTHGVFIASADGVNMFDTLINMRDELTAGNIPPLTVLDDVQGMLDHVIDKVVQNGSNQRKLKTMEENLLAAEQAANNTLAELEDIDMAAAISDLNQMEVSMQASLQMISRLNKVSILNFI